MTQPLDRQIEQSHNYRKTVLNNGLRIITEEAPYLKSVCLGIWVCSGSRFESQNLNGISHFIEHMLFKGTERRSAYAIAKEIDSVGGILNGFTGKEMTSYCCKVLSENLEFAVDLLSDIYLNASFPEEEIDREKQVVCQEIHQVVDNPEELVHEELGMKFWSGDPLGRPILGTIPSVVNLDRATLMDFKRQHYIPPQTLVCAAGEVEHERLVDLVSQRMNDYPGEAGEYAPLAPRSRASSNIIHRDLEQVHLCIGMDGPSALDKDRHAGYILNTVLGGGMSSRLFQEIREKRGLAYAVYSFINSYSDAGLFGIYLGFEPQRLDEAVKVLGDETRKLAENITEEELSTAKNQMKGHILLAMESSDALMNRLAKGEHYFGRYIALDEIIKDLEKVTLDDVKRLARDIVTNDRFTCVAVGPLDDQRDPLESFSS